MDLEETKKIIQNKIESDESARKVRSQIKSYIHEKQNLREGFTETFKPLIETSEAVKTSIDTQQNKLIKQLQDNQLALTAGLEGNRLAITQGFDKMDEVKRWDLNQLPGFEAIEYPEEPEEIEESEEPEEIEESEEAKKSLFSINSSELYKITNRVLNKLIGEEIYPDDNEEEVMPFKVIRNIYDKSPIDRSRYKVMINKEKKEVSLDDKKPITTTITYEKKQMDKYLNNKESIDLLNFYGLKLPSEYKDKSLEEFQKAFDKGMDETEIIKRSIKDVAIYRKDSLSGLILAFPKYGENAKDKSKELIREYNIMQIFINNMRELRNYKQLTGTGIIHFNNPHQLIDRLELLAGSIFAGNNGVKQEFSQIAHLLHQLKVITKKQLNDLLKKYILNK